MCKKTLITSLLVILLVSGIMQHYSVATAQGFNWAAMIQESDEAAEEAVSALQDGNNVAEAPKKKKTDNSFVRAIGAPFRALGRLFGGNKKNDQQVRRTTVKDASKFEMSKMTRIKDATVRPQPTSTDQEAPSSPSSTEFDVHLQKGRDLLLAGDVNSAIAELSSATSSNPNSAEANKLLGIAYESKGLHDRALQSFELALHAEENNPEHLNNLGYLLYKTGDYDRATKYLKKASKLSPNDARIWNNLGLAQCERGNFDDAYRSFAKASGEFGARISVASHLQRRGRAQDAIKQLEKAHALQPNSVDVLNQLVSLYVLTGRPSDAETARRTIVALKTFADANK